MKQWEIGKKIDFMWMPSGRHTITASYGRGDENVPIELTVMCNPAGADRVARSLAEIRANNPRRPPFICVEHEARERAAEPLSFKWGTIKHDGGEDSGIVCTCEPSALGVSSVNGKIFTSFSPTFDTDADYSKLQCSDCSQGRGKCACDGGRVFTFATGARGSKENPAEVTRCDSQSCGSVTNWNAFKEILPIAARQPDGAVTASGTSEGAKKGWGARRHGGDFDAHTREQFHTSDKGKRDAGRDVKKGWVTHHEADDEGGLAQHLKVTVGASDDYIKGYIAHLKSMKKAKPNARASEPDDPLLAPIYASLEAGRKADEEIAAQLAEEAELPSKRGQSVEAVFARAEEIEILVGGIELLPKTKEQELEEIYAAIGVTGH